jgi:hypothetical protein
MRSRVKEGMGRETHIKNSHVELAVDGLPFDGVKGGFLRVKTSMKMAMKEGTLAPDDKGVIIGTAAPWAVGMKCPNIIGSLSSRTYGAVGSRLGPSRHFK